MHWKDRCWSWNSNTLATWCKELTHWKRPWCWERLKAGGEGDNRGWDGFMASLSWWTWVWVGFGSWWWTGKPGVLQSMESQRVGHDWATELTAIEFLFVKEWWTYQHCLHTVFFISWRISRIRFNKIKEVRWGKWDSFRLNGKDSDAGKYRRLKEKAVTENEMVRCHHWLNGHESDQTLGDCEGQGSLACCSPWGQQRIRHDLVTEQQQVFNVRYSKLMY